MFTPRFPRLTLLSAALLLLGGAGSAAADEAICFSDEDCAPDEMCVVYTDASCADEDGGCEPVWEAYCRQDPRGAMPYPDYGCESNADCDEGFYCNADYSECVPDWLVPCSSDADCGAGLKCTDISIFDDGWDDDWDGGEEPMPMPMPEPGAEGEGGFDGSAPKNNGGEFYCLPEWLNPEPCESDADCAEGFACETYEICACGGAGGSGDSPPFPGQDPDGEPGFDGPQDFPFEDEGCECWPSDEAWCELVEVACDSDSDCLPGWTCEDGYGDAVCAVDSDGNMWCDDEDDAYDMICMPPYYGDLGAGGGGGAFEEALGGGSPRPGGPDGDAAAGGGASPPNADDSFTDRPGRSDGGCSAAPSSPAGVPAALGLLALIGLVLRRRS